MKIILSFLFFISLYSQSDSVKVNYGKHILPNGKIAIDEWDDASMLSINDEFKLFLKQDDQYLYLGIKFLKQSHTGINLYIAEADTKLKMLHVSSALGEKEFINEGWSDFIWGENDFWTANTIGSIYDDGKTKFLENEGFEFQIKKLIFTSDRWYLMIHLKRPEFIFPYGATNENLLTWFILDFSR